MVEGDDRTFSGGRLEEEEEEAAEMDDGGRFCRSVCYAILTSFSCLGFVSGLSQKASLWSLKEAMISILHPKFNQI